MNNHHQPIKKRNATTFFGNSQKPFLHDEKTSKVQDLTKQATRKMVNCKLGLIAGLHSYFFGLD
jgi:hypothetical protein